MGALLLYLNGYRINTKIFAMLKVSHPIFTLHRSKRQWWNEQTCVVSRQHAVFINPLQLRTHSGLHIYFYLYYPSKSETGHVIQTNN